MSYHVTPWGNYDILSDMPALIQSNASSPKLIRLREEIRYDANYNGSFIILTTTQIRMDELYNMINTLSIDKLISYLETASLDDQIYVFDKYITINEQNAEYILEKFDFPKTNRFLLERSLLSEFDVYINMLIRHGFSYAEMDPYNFIVTNYSNYACDISQNMDILMNAGYDLMMNDCQSFKRCFNFKILQYYLNYFIDNKIDVNEYFPLWFEQSTTDNNYELHIELTQMLNYGLNISLHEKIIFKRACSRGDLRLLQILDTANVNFKTYEVLLSESVNINNWCRPIYAESAGYTVFTHMLNLFIKHDCNLNLLSNSFVELIIKAGDIYGVKLLIEYGFEFKKLYPCVYVDHMDKKLELFNLLLSTGMSMKQCLWASTVV